MRCGALGHWAGDPEFNFPTSQGGGKGKAHLAVIADEGLSIPAGNNCMRIGSMISFCTTTSGKPLPKPWSDVTVGGTSPTPVAMMVYDEHGVPVFDTTGMP